MNVLKNLNDDWKPPALSIPLIEFSEQLSALKVLSISYKVSFFLGLRTRLKVKEVARTIRKSADKTANCLSQNDTKWLNEKKWRTSWCNVNPTTLRLTKKTSLPNPREVDSWLLLLSGTFYLLILTRICPFQLQNKGHALERVEKWHLIEIGWIKQTILSVVHSFSQLKGSIPEIL